MRERWTLAGGTRGGIAAVLALASLLLLVGRRIPAATLAAVVLLSVTAFDAAWVAVEPRWRALRARGPGAHRERVARWAPPLALFVVGLGYVWPLLFTWPPLLLDQDNAVHVERARLFSKALAEGRLPLWTHLAQGGEPLVDFYGWLGCFLPAIVKALSFSRLTFERAYEWSVALLVPVTLIAAYTLARRFSRRSIAFAVALLPLLGGHHPSPPPLTPFWSWHLIWGVWPALLALDLAVFSTACAIDVARRGRTRDVVYTVVLATAAVLTHAFGLLMLALLQGALAAAVVLGMRRRWRPFLVAIALGPMLAAFAWVPSSQALAAWGLRFATRLPEHTASFEVVLGELDTFGLTAAGLASVAALYRGDPLLRALAVVGLAGVLVDATPFLAELGLARIEAGRTIQWARLTFMFMFTASASMAFVGELLARRRSSDVRSVAFGATAARALVAFLCVLLLLPTLGRLVRDGRSKLFTDKPSRPLVDASSIEALGPALAERRRREPAPFRVHYVPLANAANTLSVAVASGVPIIHAEYVGPVFLKNRIFQPTMEEERAWGARYVVLDRGSKRPAPWVFDETIGVFDLWKDPTNPGIVRPPAGVHVETLAFRDDEVRLRVLDAPPQGIDLPLAIAYYPRWHATLNGQPIRVNAIPALPPSALPSATHAMVMSVHVTNGEVVLRPTRPMPGTAAGRSASLWGLALFAAFLLSRRFPARVQLLVARVTAGAAPIVARARALSKPLEGRQLAMIAALAALLGGVLLVQLASKPAPASTFELGSLYGERDAVERLDRTSAITSTCPRSLITRDWHCTSEDKLPGRLSALVSATTFEGQTTGAWPIGAPFPGLRVDEREGAAEITIKLSGECRRFLHPRVNGGGTSVDIALTIGERRWLVQWTQSSTIDLRNAPPGPATLHLGFGLPTAVSVGFDCDDSPEPPKPDDRTP